MRIGIFGGSFDPVHYGHLLLAETSREQLALDEVWFVPAATAPHKQQGGHASAEHRVAMLRAAIANNPGLVVSEAERQRGGVSYTVDTLDEIRSRFPAAELFLLLGADALADLPTWREPARICEMATIAVAQRGGETAADLSPLSSLVPEDRLEAFRHAAIDMPQIELSSSDIRRRIATGRSIRYQTPDTVIEYIRSHRLYRS